jgi:hypothetical protein
VPAAADPVVSFEPVEVDVNLSGYTFTIAAIPAAVWVPILTGDRIDGLDILPGLLTDQDQQRFDDLMFDGELELDQLAKTIYEIIAAASGHSWWWTMNLLSVVRGTNGSQWLGEMARYDASKMSLAGWVNALYALLVRNQKPEDRMRIDGELEMPPPGVDVEISEADQLATEATFFTMMRQSGG